MQQVEAVIAVGARACVSFSQTHPSTPNVNSTPTPMQQVEAVIRDRFGNSGLRIFRLLLLKGQLEQKQVDESRLGFWLKCVG